MSRKGLTQAEISQRSAERMDEMLLWHKAGFNHSQIARKMGLSPAYVSRKMREMGMTSHVRSGGQAHLSREQIIQIFALHARGLTVTEIGRTMGIGYSTASLTLAEAGLERNGDHAHPPRRPRSWSPRKKRMVAVERRVG